MSAPTAAASAQRESCYGRCARRERGCVVSGYATAASAGREETRLQSLQLLQSPPSPLEQTLPTLNSGNSEDSEMLRDNWRHEQAEQYTTLQAMFIEYANESQ